MKKLNHITPYLAKLGWLNIRKRRFYFLDSLKYQIKSSQIPPYLFDKINTQPPIHNYHLRKNADALFVPFAGSKSYRKMFSSLGPRFWNYLSNDIVSSCNLYVFKSRLKNHLLNNDLVF